ncbi:hypothetical protein [Flavobacterium sp. ov086]|uniref:hypothetical protein n=1 Tax=Flavobacterium sp. ov086 TaxID=1761785 RepID=UPI000B67EB5F|nr:hypothetical protein [Flavobacterium sp. ov086]SNR23743.1 hypothetical protein SAMN04487979_101220 [Flavobacterium sp. ov086]
MRTTKLEKLKITKRIFLFVLTLALTNCQDSENSTEQEQSRIKTVSINDAKTFLTRSTNNPTAKLASNEIGDLEFDKATLEKLNGSDQLLTVIPFATNNEVRNDRVLVVKIDDEIRSVILSMQPEENSTQDHFSGKVFIYSLEGDFITGYGAKDGIYIGQYLKEKSNSKTSKNPQDGEGGVLIINYYKKPVNAVNATDWDAIWGSAGSSMGWTPVGGVSGVTWDATGGGGGSGITAPTNDQIIAALEKQIDGTALDPCPKAVLEQLKNATNCDIANILTKLNANKTYNVKVTSGNSGNVPASTVRTSNNNYSIILSNDSYTSSSQLFKASILLHEIGHAFFMSLVDDYTASKNPAVFGEFPTLFQKYVDTKYPGSKEDAQHEEMANTYVNSIGAALQEFQTGVPVKNGVPPNQIYTDLAWGGLRDAPIFDKKFPQGTAERLRIDNRLASEQTSHTVGAGTPQEQTPIGKPCN